jgi:hypothetical protein
MAKMTVIEQLGQKKADIEAIAAQVIAHPESIAQLAEAIQIEKSAAKFAYDKVLRLVSEQKPELIYPYFDVFVQLLGSDNSFLKWGAILTIANLTAVDTERKFEAIFARYYTPIKGPVMVTAANIIGSSPKIVASKPGLTQRITREILKVEKAKYERHGNPSPECRNVALGHAIDAFDEFFDQIGGQDAVIRFVRRQRKNARPKVAKKAERFLWDHLA